MFSEDLIPYWQLSIIAEALTESNRKIREEHEAATDAMLFLRRELAALRTASFKYLNDSDSGVYRDGAGMTPGASPCGENLRVLLRGEWEK
jgi:hypothetical protein